MFGEKAKHKPEFSEEMKQRARELMDSVPQFFLDEIVYRESTLSKAGWEVYDQLSAANQANTHSLWAIEHNHPLMRIPSKMKDDLESRVAKLEEDVQTILSAVQTVTALNMASLEGNAPESVEE